QAGNRARAKPTQWSTRRTQHAQRAAMGELAGLGSALLWAIGSVLARAQSRQVDAVTLNLTRVGASALVYVALALVTGRLGEVTQVPLRGLGLMWASVVVGLAIGDTLFFASLRHIGAARSLPIV